MDSPAGAAACLVTHSEKTVARALAVPDVVEAEKELRRFEIDYWTLKDVAAPNLQQLFFRDPAGNQIELHQIGCCRCKKSDWDAAAKAAKEG